ncbi:MAG: twin-arginine translocation signal domain-containing protein, partial [Halomonas sp.]
MQRRNFLKTVGLGAAGVAAAPFVTTSRFCTKSRLASRGLCTPR